MTIKMLKMRRQEKPEGGHLEIESFKEVIMNQDHSGTKLSEPIKGDENFESNKVKADGADELEAATKPKGQLFQTPLVWKNIILFIILHMSVPYTIKLVLDPETRPHWQTIVWLWVASYASGLGVTGGAHRLWSHKSYKARMPVEVLLMCLQSMAGQNSIYTWCRDHRVHHKFSETDADPHNIKRGFFFAHMGWLLCRKHPEVRAKGQLIDMSDLEANPVVMFQHRNFWWLAVLWMLVVPTAVPVLFWNERLVTSFVIAAMYRYVISLHSTWLVNSAAHTQGMRPYDDRIEARESFWTIVYGLGEGFHNYHHTFPFDYSTSEFGRYFNLTTAMIDLFALMGLVYDRRKADKDMLMRRKLRTGEGRLHDTLGEAKESADGQANGKRMSSFNMDYISDKTSLKYTM